LDAELTDNGLRTSGVRFITIRFGGGDDIRLSPRDEHVQEFIDAVLDRIGTSSG
jgi:hypothetical protein